MPWVRIAVQVAGKLRGTFRAPRSTDGATLLAHAWARDGVVGGSHRRSIGFVVRPR